MNITEGIHEKPFAGIQEGTVVYRVKRERKNGTVRLACTNERCNASTIMRANASGLCDTLILELFVNSMSMLEKSHTLEIGAV